MGIVMRGLAPALLALMAALAVPARAQVSEAVAERVMRDSGVWEQVADLGPQLKQGFLRAAERPPAELGSNMGEVMRRLADATDEAFGPLALRLAARREVSARLDPAHMPALQTWLGSGLGQRITALEVAKSAERADSEARLPKGEQLLAAASPERRRMVQEFVEVTRNAEAASSSMMNLMLALQVGVARTMGRQDVPPLSTLREQLEPQRLKMQGEMAPIVLQLAADMYAPLSDADLRDYLAFQASPAGRHLTEVMIRALDAAVAESAEELGRLVAPR